MKITGRIIMNLLGETKLIRFVQNFFEPFSIGNHDAIASWRLLDKERSQLMDGKRTNSHSTFVTWAERLKQEEVYRKLIAKIEIYQSQNSGQISAFRKMFEEDKTDKLMPHKLAEKIERKFENEENCEAILLLLLWSIYRQDISLLSFLYTNDQIQRVKSPCEECIDNTQLPSDISKNIFSFRNPNTGFYGRTRELQRLNTWMEQPSVSVWAVTGPGGSGKSKLALFWAQQTLKTRKVVWMNHTLLTELLHFNDFSYPKPVLFICDYAAQYEKPLKELIEKCIQFKVNAKFLLLERSNAWYSNFLKSNDSIWERAYLDESINLEKSALSENDCAHIVQNFSLNQYGKKVSLEISHTIIEQAKLLTKSDCSARCLFLLLLTDAYLNGANIGQLDATNLLNTYIDHSRSILTELYGKENVVRGYRILAYATVIGGLKWENEQTAIQNDIEAVIDSFFEDRQQIVQFFSMLSESDGTDIIPPVKPDLIGEFVFLHEWSNLIKQTRLKWLSYLLPNAYCRAYIALCLSDWKTESTLLCNTLIDTTIPFISENRIICAELFYESVRSAHTNQNRRWLIEQIKKLDDGDSAQIRLLYARAISDTIEFEDKEQRELYISTISKIQLDVYSLNTDNSKLQVADVFSCFAKIFVACGEYQAALKYEKRDMELRESILDSEHSDLASAYHGTGRILHYLGEYVKSKEYYEAALAIRKKTLGLGNPQTAESYNNLGIVYQSIGRYDTALEYFNKALAIRKAVYGEDHPDTASSYHNISTTYLYKGEYISALEYAQKAMEIRKKTLGTIHQRTARVYNCIGLIYLETGDFEKSLTHFRMAQNIKESLLGNNHPDTAWTYIGIATVYRDMSKFDLALEYCKKALSIRETVLGMSHPETAIAYDLLASIYRNMGQFDMAVIHYEKSLHIRESVFGSDSLAAGQSIEGLAGVYYAKGSFESALDYYQKALAIYEAFLGMSHPNTATVYGSIGNAYKSLGDYDRALEMHQKSLQIKEQVLGQKHLSTAMSYSGVAGIYYVLKRYDDALRYYNAALSIREDILGSNHPNTAKIYHGIALVYFAQSDYDKSLEFFQRAMDVREKVLGSSHLYTAETYCGIADLYKAKGNSCKAVEYYKRALQIYHDVLGNDSPQTIKVNHTIKEMSRSENTIKG